MTDGKTTFCPGCPNAGNFVGEITRNNFEVTSTDPKEYALTIRSSVRLVLTDEDGMQSRPVTGSSVQRDEVQAAVERFRDQGVGSVLNRISRCVGTTAVVRGVSGNYRTEFDCPALNRDVVDKLSKEG
jgi:hypothetical protein